MSTAQVQDRVREGAGARLPLRITAGGSWLDAGRPVREATPLSLAGDDAIIEYVPGDLTLTARAGASLAEIAHVTAAEGQWLAVDPFGALTGTLGATIATGSAGPLAHAFGTPRDNVLGIEAVTGTGDVVRAGGRVVKNVAGFDLTRLFTGAWGTLAVITEATVRLRARPERDETIALALPSEDEMESWLARLRALPFSALALELLNSSLSRALGLGDRALLLARLGGNTDSVRTQLQLLRALGDSASVPESIWSRFTGIEPLGASVARLSAPPSRLHALWNRITASRDSAVLAHATVGRGIVRSIRPASHTIPIGVWLSELSLAEGTRIFERLPDSDWDDVPPRVNDPLSRAVRAAFDPMRVLNRGILGDVA